MVPGGTRGVGPLGLGFPAPLKSTLGSIGPLLLRAISRLYWGYPFLGYGPGPYVRLRMLPFPVSISICNNIDFRPEVDK